MDGADLKAENARLEKVIQVLMDRIEKNTYLQGSDYNVFQTTIILEDQVRRRTEELEAALLENEKITRALRETENRNRLLVENSPMCIHEIDLEGNIISMNRAGLIMFGFKEERDVNGSAYLDIVSPGDKKEVQILINKALAGESSSFEFKSVNPEGHLFQSCFVPIKDKTGVIEKLMGITENITERKKAEEQIRFFAFNDTLTKLPNRRLLNDRLEMAMAASKRSGRFGVLMFLELDNFKLLNDTYGHDVGDLLLIEVAYRITSCIRKIDTVARLGGDEFVVLLNELDISNEVSYARAGIVAENLRINLGLPYVLKSKNKENIEIVLRHKCTVSIGVVLFNDHESDQEEILKKADEAMYQAKKDGRNNIRFFDKL